VTEEMNAAAKTAQDALRDKEAAETRAAALEAELNGAQETSQKTIDTLRNQNAEKEQLVAARDRTVNELKSQAATFQQTIASSQQQINTLQSQLSRLTQQINAVRDTVAPPAANNASSTGSAALDAAKQQASNAFNRLDEAFE
jgi:chromosome segregation ATPase